MPACSGCTREISGCREGREARPSSESHEPTGAVCGADMGSGKIAQFRLTHFPDPFSGPTHFPDPIFRTHFPRSNEVRLWLSVIAYNLGNLWRRLVLPNKIGNWSLTSLQHGW